MKNCFRNVALFLGLAAICVAFVGCGPNDGMTEIKGKVTLDGAPLKEGTINFAPKAGGTGTASGAKIVDGAYVARVSPGTTLGVAIEAEEMQQKEGATQEEIERGADKIPVSIIPAKYNRQSELSIDVTDGAKGPFDFELTSEE